jgi:hypothetical protein
MKIHLQAISLSLTSAGTRKAGRQAGKKAFVSRQKKHGMFCSCRA